MITKRLISIYILFFLSCLRIPDVKLPGAKPLKYQKISSEERAERTKYYNDSLEKIREINWYTCWEEQIEFSKINGFNDTLLSILKTEFDSTYDSVTLHAVDSIYKNISFETENSIKNRIKRRHNKSEFNELEDSGIRSMKMSFSAVDSIYSKGTKIKRTKDFSSKKPILILDSCSFSHLDSNNYLPFIQYVNTNLIFSVMSKKQYNIKGDSSFNMFMYFGTIYGKKESKEDSIMGDTLPHIFITKQGVGSGWIYKYDLEMNIDSTYNIIKSRFGGIFHY